MSAVGLEWLPRMRVLNLAQNDITRVTGLSRASHLRSLCLDGNSIRFIEADSFVGCGALVELRLADNNLRTLAHLDVCRGLQVLAANANRIPELGELDALAALPRLQELALQNNPVARKHLYHQLAIFKLPQVGRGGDGGGGAALRLATWRERRLRPSASSAPSFPARRCRSSTARTSPPTSATAARACSRGVAVYPWGARSEEAPFSWRSSSPASAAASLASASRASSSSRRTAWGRHSRRSCRPA